MPDRCVVPRCPGSAHIKIALFKFPNEDFLRKKWINAIKRVDFTPTKYNDEIIKTASHFDIKTGKTLSCGLKNFRLDPNAVPSILPNCPTYLSATPSKSRESPNAKRIRLERAVISKTLNDKKESDELLYKNKLVKSLEDLKLKLEFVDHDFWTTINFSDRLSILHFDPSNPGKVKYCTSINSDLIINTYIEGIYVSKLGHFVVPKQVTNIDNVSNILNEFKNINLCRKYNKKCDDNSILIIQLVLSLLSNLNNAEYAGHRIISFISMQLCLLVQKKKKYSSDWLIFSSLFHNISPQGYKFFQNSDYIILPTYSILRRLTSNLPLNPLIEQEDTFFLNYIKQKFLTLSPEDKTVNLLMDQIHLKAFWDYKGGNIGCTSYNEETVAFTAYVFMLSSIMSSFRDVVHIVPVRTIKAEELFTFIKQIIIGLETMGFKVISVVSNNSAINKKAMSLFHSPPKVSILYLNPFESKRPLFYLFDPVKILKCIRNNWINKKDNDITITFPLFSEVMEDSLICTASFNTIRELYNLESDSDLNSSYELSKESIFPSNLERQSVNLALSIFNDNIVTALNILGKQHNLNYYEDTADFISIISQWWTIFNVKTPFETIQLNNINSMPLTNNINDTNFNFLKTFLQWIDHWSTLSSTNKFNQETMHAITHTTHAMIELVDYCINELDMDYILTGKFQTDPIEERFSKYKLLSYSNYNISTRKEIKIEKE